MHKDFASAAATKGLSDRPLETFGSILMLVQKGDLGTTLSRTHPQEVAASHYYASEDKAARREDSVNLFTDPSQSSRSKKERCTIAQPCSPADERPDAQPHVRFQPHARATPKKQRTKIAKRGS